MRIPTVRLPAAKEGVRYLSDLIYALNNLLSDIGNQLNNLAEGNIAAVNNATTGPPTTGAHTAGDFVRNKVPTVAGSAGSQYAVFGWLCVASGTPGTWVALRASTGT